MTEHQRIQLDKFEKFTAYMCKDSQKALYVVGAQFLVAQALFNYIEIVGSFLVEGSVNCKERFNKFFVYLGIGKEYEKLLEEQPEIYNELRCGLTHEFLPKARRFSIVKFPDGLFTIKQIDNNDPQINYCANNILDNNSSKINCGILYSDQNNLWKIIVPKFLADFEKGITKLIKELKDENNVSLMTTFFARADTINIDNFN